MSSFFRSSLFARRFFSFLCGCTPIFLFAVPTVSFAQVGSRLLETTKLNISVIGTAKAIPDEITATFFVESQNKSAAFAQQSVNNQINNALKITRTAKDVKSVASQYSVFHTQFNNRTHSSWTAQQVFTLTANNAQAILPLVGELQAHGFILKKLEWSLSKPQQQAALLEADKNALTTLMQQTKVIATALKGHITHFESLNFSESPSFRPIPVMFATRSVVPVFPIRTEEMQTLHVRCEATVILAP